MPLKDPEQRRAYLKTYHQKWYIKNRDSVLARSKENRKIVRARNIRIVEKAKDRPCMDCGVHYPRYVMQLDHVRGEKVKGVSRLAWDLASVVRLQTEIDKCEAVCANCHAERTFRRTGPSVLRR